MKFPYRIQRTATAPAKPKHPGRPLNPFDSDGKATYRQEVEGINKQYAEDVGAYQRQLEDNKKVQVRQSLPGANTRAGQSVLGKRIGDVAADLLVDRTPRAIGYGSAGLGLAALALADPLNVYSEGGLFQQDPMAQARYKAARAMDLAGTPGVAKAIFEDQINQTLPGGGAFMRDPDADPTELQLPRDSDYPGQAGGYVGGAHVPSIDVGALVDARAQQLMQMPYQTADGSLTNMSYPTAINRAQEEIALELRANGIV